ncbi:MAG: hypothetical protein E6J63_23730 [Deltaproteobacteria bacterium]|nr:MAG: hypothetical protein E6J63_23730 [Deltaproteobacteria bacterium]
MNTLRPIAAIALLSLFAVSSAAIGAPSDGATSRPGEDKASAIVQLKGDPLATSAKTKPPQGKKIDFDSAAVKSYRANLSALRNDFKAWLRTNAPGAKVTGEFDISLNAVSLSLNGEKLETIAAAPMVQRAEYQGLYYPTVDDPDLGLINAIAAWGGRAGAATAGAGVKVAIIDTGIDVTHPCFKDAGYAPQNQLGDRNFTNNKVIAAKVFNNKTPSQGFTAEAIQDHGTHVSGTVACNFETPATVNGVTIPYKVSGVAPRALLGNYNVFPGQVSNARSEDILNAMEAAYADGFDVGNMSLGGGSHGIQDLLTIAVDDLDQANMVFAVAAGNSGPGHFTVESPGSAARALSAGASTVPHFVGAPVTIGSRVFGAASGDFKTVTTDLTAPLGVVTSGTALSMACTALAAGSLSGKIALISRGICTFSTKIRNAQNAGAVAVLVVNNVAGDPTAMGTDGTPNQPTAPAYMVALSDRAALVESNGKNATISATAAYFSTSNGDIMAGFSSQGPTDVDFRVKPDVVAPGVNVLSSIPAKFCAAPASPSCWAFFQGTSMATPHLAGSAAVVRQQHPTWSAAAVRSAVVNTADQGVLKDFRTASLQPDVNIIGAGRENLLAAVGARVALDPVSVSFGAVPSGSGQSRSVAVTVTNLGADGSFSLAVADVTSSGVSFAVSPSTLTIRAGESGTATVTMSAAKGAALNDYQATLSVSTVHGGVEVAHAAVYTLVK